jgi:tetratricopeptide (TPR) repeat protein
MGKLVSWAQIDFDRWLAFAASAHAADSYGADNLVVAIERTRVSWTRIMTGLMDLFTPAGPRGTHGHAHYHGPTDPEARQFVLNALAADYETALFFLDIALELSARCLGAAAAMPFTSWKQLGKEAEKSGASLAPDIRETILYLQRTVLYSRNESVTHPQDHMAGVTFDSLANIRFQRRALEPDESLLPELDDLLHHIQPEIAATARVGTAITASMALTWVSERSGLMSAADRDLFTKLRESLGYDMPWPYAIAGAINRFIEGIIELTPPSGFAAIALHASRDPLSTPLEDEVVDAHDPDDPAAVDREEARGIELGAAGDHLGAITAFRRVVSLDPDNPIGHANLGEALSQAGQYDEAITYMNRAEALGYRSPAMTRGQIRSHFNLAAKAFNAGSFDVAAPHYRQVLELNPLDGEARGHYAVSLLRQGRHDAALLEIARVVRDHQDSARAQLDAGVVLIATRNLDTAVSCFDRALALDPHFAEANAQRGTALAIMGRLDEAESALTEALRQDPTNEGALANLAVLQRKTSPNQAVEA